MLIMLKVVMHHGNLEIKTLRVEDFKPGLNVYNDWISFGANTSVGVGFMATRNIHPIPELAIFSLTMGVIKHHPIMLLSNTTFNITEDKQLLHVKFEPQRITLPEKEILLDGEFRWHPKKEPLFVVRDKRMHTHFRCVIHYKVAPIDKIHF